MYDTTIRDVLPTYTYHPLYRRVFLVLLYAQRCAHACSDVSGYIPFGVTTGEPETSESARLKCALMDTHEASTMTDQRQISDALRQGVEALRNLEQEQEMFLNEFAEVRRMESDFRRNTSAGGAPNHFACVEPPALWFSTQPALVCPWRSMQHDAFFAPCWDEWAPAKHRVMCTDVLSTDVLCFLNDLVGMALQTLSGSNYALGVSTEGWSTLKKTFRVKSLRNRDVWSGVTESSYADADMQHAWIPSPQLPMFTA